MNHQLICALLPEICLAGFGLGVLLLETIKTKLNNTVYYLSIFGLFASLIIIWFSYNNYDFNNYGLIFNNTIYIIKAIVCLLTVLVMIYVKPILQKLHLLHAEWVFLYLLATLGLFLLISANNFLVLYIAIELYSLPICILIALHRNNTIAIEAAYKYLILSAVASMFLLYGISLLYGLTGEIGFSFTPQITTENAIFKISMVLILVGIFFKLGLVPFHFWIPDLYAGANIAIASFIAVVPKVALIFVLQQILSNCFKDLVSYWQTPLLYLALISITVGNLAAFLQDDWRRLIGYSAIANVGFAVLGVVVATTTGYNAAIFYMFVYSLIYMLIFISIAMLTNSSTTIIKIQDLAGLATASPAVAALILLGFLALLGLPPFASFFAKLLVLIALIKQGYLAVALIAIVISLFGILYCYKIVRIMFFTKPLAFATVPVLSKSRLVLLVVNLIIICLLGFWVEYFKIY